MPSSLISGPLLTSNNADHQTPTRHNQPLGMTPVMPS